MVVRSEHIGSVVSPSCNLRERVKLKGPSFVYGWSVDEGVAFLETLDSAPSWDRPHPKDSHSWRLPMPGLDLAWFV